MNKIQNYIINYNLLEENKEFYIKSKILPICKDEIYTTLAICENSQLDFLSSKFTTLIKYIEIPENDILFILNSIDLRIKLFKLLEKSIKNENIEEEYIKEFIFLILELSIKNRASDIHIESFEKQLFIRLRIDGKLKIFFTFSSKYFALISSSFKVMANLDITLRLLPQDGRFNSIIENNSYDFRISSMPSIHGESLVIRILDNNNVNKTLDDLGFSKNIYTQLKDILKLRQGLVLITGPTGSGKTTTLYSLLQELNFEDKKIITIEDPVEYKIDSIIQIGINEKIGLSFEKVLKNILRQDPDIILIGEIRDKFSLDIALQASLTGHLVIASIHASSCVETISRLIDLNSDSFLIASTLKMILSQRLVLNICKSCSFKGCEICNYTGYYDRSSIAEVLVVDEKISSMIFKKEDTNLIKRYLEEYNFKTILDDGKYKVSQNITSLEEVYKVISI